MSGPCTKTPYSQARAYYLKRRREKENLAMLAGWRVLKVDVKHVTSGQALQWIQEALKENA